MYAVVILPLKDCFRVCSGRSGAVRDRSDILRAQYYAKKIDDLNHVSSSTNRM